MSTLLGSRVIIERSCRGGMIGTMVRALTSAACGLVMAPLHAEVPAAQLERGRQLMAQYQCGSCHTIPGVLDARGLAASPLGGFGRRSYIAGRIPNDPQLLQAWIVDPRALVPDTRMPAMGVSRHQARDIAAYLLALP